MTEHGTCTQDLRIRHAPHPADPDPLEVRIRRFGIRSLTAGLILAPATFMFCLIARILAGNRTWTDTQGKMFGALALITALIAAAALMLIGAIERLQRPFRARQKQSALDIDRNRILIERVALDIQERYDNLVGLAGALPGRLAALETSFSTLAGVLPDSIQREYWLGFNAAVREGFADQATGTDGKPRRRRIGLVPPDKDNQD